MMGQRTLIEGVCLGVRAKEMEVGLGWRGWFTGGSTLKLINVTRWSGLGQGALKAAEGPGPIGRKLGHD